MLKKALANRGINLLNLHIGLFFFAENLVNIFLGVYLYRLGVPLPGIFLTLGSINFLRLFLRPVVLHICYRIGLRRTVIIGILTYLPLYPLLTQIKSIDIWLGLFILIAAIPHTFYWTAYHPYFSILGDLEHRGKQIGAREIAVQSAAIVAPLAGGFLITAFGFDINILIAMIIMTAAAFPLFCTPEAPLSPPLCWKEAYKKVGKEGFWLFFADNFHINAHDITWRLILFLLLKDYFSYGGLLALAVVFQMIGALFVGSAFDKGSGKKLFPLGIAMITLVIFGRVFWADSVPVVIMLDFLFALGYCLYLPLRDSVIYNLSKKSHCPLWFHYFAEIGADVGAVLTCLLAALFLSFGGELRFVMLFSIFGLIIAGKILSRFFSQKDFEISKVDK